MEHGHPRNLAVDQQLYGANNMVQIIIGKISMATIHVRFQRR